MVSGSAVTVIAITGQTGTLVATGAAIGQAAVAAMYHSALNADRFQAAAVAKAAVSSSSASSSYSYNGTHLHAMFPIPHVPLNNFSSNSNLIITWSI